MQVSELMLQHHMAVVRAGDVAGPASTGTEPVQSLVHGGDHRGMLSHAQIVVRAPHRNGSLATRPVMRGMREIPSMPFQIREDAVVALSPEAIELFAKQRLIVHGRPPRMACLDSGPCCCCGDLPRADWLHRHRLFQTLAADSGRTRNQCSRIASTIIVATSV